MRITLLNDLHLEFDDFSGMVGGDILLLAGDICEAHNLHRYTSFIEEISEKFRQVYVIMGNHDHYNSIFQDTITKLKEIYQPYKNIKVLEKETVELPNGMILYGATLWTNFNNNIMSKIVCQKSLNDFTCIKYESPIERSIKRNFYPDDAVLDYKWAIAILGNELETHPDNDFLVMTHHAPCQQSIATLYKNDTDLNGGFVNHLEEFILEHPQIKYWVHGHTHNSFDYMIGQCRVICNPRGYGKENKFVFKKDFSFEV
jgi:predicted phosphohydrolase